MKTAKILALAALLTVAGCKSTPKAPTSASPSSPANSVTSSSHAIYPDPPQARNDLAQALQVAAHSHKRILLDFGGNWCPDCQVLDIYCHDAQNRPILEANFILVHVNIGRIDANLDLAAQYRVPLKRGVPALAVLSDSGRLLYSQQGGEFEDMRHLDSSALTAFLNRWKPATPPHP